VGGPGVAVVLPMLMYVSAYWYGDAPLGLFANVATGPGVPTNVPGGVAEVIDEPRVREPTPYGEFSIGAGDRFAAVSAHDNAPAGSLSWNRKFGPIARTSSTNGASRVSCAISASASTPIALTCPYVPAIVQVCGQRST
jgi:hypothetical protein